MCKTCFRDSKEKMEKCYEIGNYIFMDIIDIVAIRIVLYNMYTLIKEKLIRNEHRRRRQ